MKRAFTILWILCTFGLSAYSQNLVQNPSFENLTWDEFWVLSLTAPSTATAEAALITTDAHEGINSLELHNTKNNGWTYFYTDSSNAAINLKRYRSYEIRGWLRSVEQGKGSDVSFYWNGSQQFLSIYSANPDPVSNPDWFLVKDTLIPLADVNDGYLRLGLRADRAVDGSGMGRLLFDDFSITLVEDDSDADIYEFTVPDQVGAEVIDLDLGTINLEVPFGTDLRTLAPDHIEITSGASISPGIGVPRDFRVPVVYTVTARDGFTTRDWTVTITTGPPSTASAITSFDLPDLIAPATINGGVQLVLGRVPYGTDITTLVPSIEVSSGATINPLPGVPTDFTNPVTYIVTAQDGTTSQNWTVAILVERNTETDITFFDIPELDAPAAIDNLLHTVTGTVPFGTDMTSLVPSIGLSGGASINPLSDVARDFSSPVTYTVTADDGTTTQDWVVSITAGAASSETDIVSFTIPELDAPATIDNLLHTVMGSVPYGTDLTILVPTLGVSTGATISPASDVATDFSSSVTYTVTAQDGISTQDWVVSIQVLPNTAAEITSFDIPELATPVTIDNLLSTVDGMVPYGTVLTALVPTIEVSTGATINPPSGTANDFSSPVTYTVMAEDGTTTQDWVISISLAPNTETDITGFTLAEQTGAASIDPLTHTIDIEVDYGTNLGFLAPIIQVSPGATIDPLSGVSRDFSSGTLYTVTAEDGTTTQEWTITVSLATPNTETDITGFSIPQLISPAVIDYSLHTISGTVLYGTDLTARVPTISVSTGASINPASGVLTDLSSPVTYTVTAQDGITTQDWVISIATLPNTETDITRFSLAEQTGPSTINRTDHTIEIEVNSGTDVSDLVPTLEVSPGASVDPADGVSQDFTNAVEYLVTAEDGISTENWTVNVSVARAVGIGDQNVESIRIYPNPASEFIFIELRGDTHIRMHDLLGKLHYSADHLNGDQRINVSEFKEGIYIISLLLEDGSLQQRKIILR